MLLQPSVRRCREDRQDRQDRQDRVYPLVELLYQHAIIARLGYFHLLCTVAEYFYLLAVSRVSDATRSLGRMEACGGSRLAAKSSQAIEATRGPQRCASFARSRVTRSAIHCGY